MSTRYLILAISCLLTLSVWGQQAKIDSLENLASQKSGSEQLWLELEIAKLNRKLNPKLALKQAEALLQDSKQQQQSLIEGNTLILLCRIEAGLGNYRSSQEYGDLAVALFTEMRHKPGLADINLALGGLQIQQAQYQSARLFYFKALAISKELDEPGLEAEAYHRLSISHYFQHHYDSAFYYSNTALKIRTDIGQKADIAESLYNLGILYQETDQADKAIEATLKSLQMRQQLDDQYGMAGVLNTLGIIHMNLGEFEQATEYYLRSLDLYLNQSRLRGAAVVLNNLGVIEFDSGNLEQALSYHHRGLKLSQSVGYKRGLGMAYSNMAEIFLEQSAYDSALYYNKNAYKIRSELGASHTIAKSSRNLAEVFIRTGQFDSASYYLENALNIAKASDSKGGIKNAHFLFSQLYEQQSQYQLALKHLKLAEALEDSLFTEEQSQTIADLRLRYETAQTEQQLAIANKENQVARLWRSILIGLALALLIIGVVVYRYQRFKTIQNQQKFEAEKQVSEELQELDQAKSRFFANISHEFRTPLTLIQGPVDRQLSVDPQNYDLQLVKKSSFKLLKLVNQLLDLSKLDAGKLDLTCTPQIAEDFVSKMVMLFESQCDQKNIQLQVKHQNHDTQLFFDGDKMEHILENLISNALKWTTSGGWIKVSTTTDQTHFFVEVADNGVGIKQDALPYVFERFYQAHHEQESQGTGIGLSLTKELVELHHGTIAVKSELGAGTLFTIKLPLGHEHLDANNLSFTQKEHVLQIESNTELTQPQEGETSSSYRILIVDDNNDVRQYIRTVISTQFEVLEAIDGAVAWEQILSEVPDLILSDVMMPNVDGYDLCKQIKSDHRTSHIPVILLTAKGGHQDRIKGLEYRADDYILKPFNSKELLLKIDNLLRLRTEIQNKFSFGTKPDQLFSSLDEEFLKNMNTVLADHYASEMFGVAQWAQEIGMSRSHLHRKVIALTGKSPNNLLRSFRLEKALVRIKQNSGTISEIAYAVGFSSPAYFSKCFSEEYGKTPKEVRQGMQPS